MMKTRSPLPLLASLLVLLLTTLAGAQATQPSTGPFLFSSFKGNGEDGLHLAYSRDGYTWTSLNHDQSYLKPTLGQKEKLMRDPCILRGPDGTFHLVWTVGWRELAIGHASSKDLVHWSEQQSIKVMEQENAADVHNVWAPELFYDDAKGQYLIFWASTVTGKFTETEPKGENKGNHRIYYVTTKDFKTFSPTKLLLDPGFNCIDATIKKVGDRYAIVFKDETPEPTPKKFILFAWGDSPEGPWGKPSDPITPSWSEGPSVLHVGDEWLVYYDHYRSPQHYGAVKTRDWKTWEDATKQLSFPKGTKHGTAFPVSDDVLQQLMKNGN